MKALKACCRDEKEPSDNEINILISCTDSRKCLSGNQLINSPNKRVNADEISHSKLRWGFYNRDEYV